jgi:putative membrane protein
VAALLVTGIDLLIEQVAPKLDFGNLKVDYLIYKLVSWRCFLHLTFFSTIIKGNRTVSLIILILQIIFFTFYIYLFNMEIIINSSIVLVTLY